MEREMKAPDNYVALLRRAHEQVEGTEERMSFDEDEDRDFDPWDGYCIDCGGEGWIVTCIDDLCHGAGYCIHGDGMALCHCNSNLEKNYAPDNAPRNWKAPKDLRVVDRRKS